MVSNLGNIPQIDEILVGLYKTRTLAEISAWDEQAQGYIDTLEKQKTAVEGKISETKEKLTELEKAHFKKGFFGKLIADRSYEHQLHAHLNKLESKLTVCDDYIVELLSEKDFSPNSLDDLKALLNELKAYRQELRLEKRSVRADMQAARTEVRRRSSDYFRTTAITRRLMRIEKEAAIAPHENAVLAIEKKLIVLERKINWLTEVQKSK